MQHDKFSRRSILRTGGVGLATVAAGGLAGCSGIPLIGGGDDSGSTYHKWLPNPDDLTGQDHYYFSQQNFDDIHDNEAEFDDDRDEVYQDHFGLLDLTSREVSSRISIDAGFVLQGDFSTSRLEETLASDADYDDETDLEGFTIYLGPDERRAVGVSGSAIVSGWGNDENDPVETVELIIDAKNGNVDRYSDESEDFDALVNSLGSGSLTSGRTFEPREEDLPESGRLENSVASGLRRTIKGETTDFELTLVFEDADDVDENDLEDYQEYWEDSSDVDDPSFSTSGRAVTFTATKDTDQL